MTIGINTNDLIMDNFSMIRTLLESQREKVVNPEDYDNLLSFFDDEQDMEDFIYDHALEIHGHARAFDKSHILKLNQAHNNLIKKGFKLSLITNGVHAIIPSTLFFLSLNVVKVKNLAFLAKKDSPWDYCDVYFTRRKIEDVPEGKELVVVNDFEEIIKYFEEQGILETN